VSGLGTHRAPLAMLAACGAAFLWGTGALVVNLLIARFHLRPESISFWRFVIGAVFLLAVFGRPGLGRKAWGHAKLLVTAGTAMALYVLCWFLGIERIGAAIPTLIALCLPPVLVTLVAVARGQEALDASLALTLGAALAGTVLIVLRHGGAPDDAGVTGLLIGVGFSVASAVLYAGFTLVSGRLSTDLGAGPATTCLTIVAAAVMGLTALYTPLAWPDAVPPEAWILYLGLVTAALALLAFSWSAAYLSPTALTVATLFEPLTAVLLSSALLDQHLDARQWLGAVLLLGGIFALGRRSARGR
jgi:DME family drug/metabolite transporter